MSSTKKYILAHDMGTSANKAVLINKNANIVDSVKTEYDVIYPQLGYAEQDPNEWWKAISSQGIAKIRRRAGSSSRT